MYGLIVWRLFEFRIRVWMCRVLFESLRYSFYWSPVRIFVELFVEIFKDSSRYLDIKEQLFLLVNISFEVISAVTEGSGAFSLNRVDSIFFVD